MQRSPIAAEGRWFIVPGALLTLSLLSCQGETYDLPRDKVWRSPHFAYHTRSGDGAVCEGIVAKLEQHFSSIQTMFGFDWPNGRTIDYYKFRSQTDFSANSPCPVGSAACTEGNNLYSHEVFEQHELIRTYLWPFALPPPVIAEGAAVALVCDRTIPESPPLSLSDAMRVHDALSDQRVYGTGARLVRYLLASYGPRPFLRFYASLGQGSSFEDLDRAMHAEFDLGADAAWAAALATPTNCPPPFPCSRESVELGGMPTEVSGTCGLTRDERTLDLVADSEIAIAGSASLYVGSCDPIHFAPIFVTSAGAAVQQIGVVQLLQGHYYLSIQTSAPTSVQVIEPPVPWAGIDCAALQPLIVPAGQNPDLRLSVPPDAPDWAVRLRFEELRQVAVQWPADADLIVCPDCSQSRCQTWSLPSHTSKVSWQGDYVLRLQGVSGSEPAILDIIGD